MCAEILLNKLSFVFFKEVEANKEIPFNILKCHGFAHCPSLWFL